MKVDTVVAALHDLGEERVGNPARETPAGAAWKTPIQIASIWQVARVTFEAQCVEDRSQDKRAGAQLEGRLEDQLTHRHRAVDLISMHRPRNEDHGPGTRSPPNPNRDIDPSSAQTFTDANVNVSALTSSHSDIRQLEAARVVRARASQELLSVLGTVRATLRLRRRSFRGTRSRMASSRPKQSR